MKLHRLKPASEFEVLKWINSVIELTPYQKEKLNAEEIRHSPFYFYRVKEKTPVSPLWRFTILLYPIYLIILIAFLPFVYLITGHWNYGRTFIEKFHNAWLSKLKI